MESRYAYLKEVDEKIKLLEKTAEELVNLSKEKETLAVWARMI